MRNSNNAVLGRYIGRDPKGKTKETEMKLHDYLAELKAFQRHLNIAFEVLMCDGCTDESVTLFYNSEFTISWRGKSVTLANGAEVFQAIEEIVQTEIDDYEEV